MSKVQDFGNFELSPMLYTQDTQDNELDEGSDKILNFWRDGR